MVTNAAVDWMTMTSPKDRVGMYWYTIYIRYRDEKILEADKEKPFNNGFYSGLGIASMRWGFSEHLGYILIVSGGDAERLWQRVDPVQCNVTRLDLCVDFVTNDVTYLARELFMAASDERKAAKPGLSLFIGPEGGDTLYVGSRHSQQFGRLYDKGVESGTAAPGRHWRAEVEYKKPLSGLMAEELVKEQSGQRVQAITDTVLNWFSDRGIVVIKDIGVERQIKISVEQRVTTSRKKLAWLRSQVQPTVRQLVSLGLGREVMRSLLMDEDTLLRIFATEN